MAGPISAHVIFVARALCQGIVSSDAVSILIEKVPFIKLINKRTSYHIVKVSIGGIGHIAYL